MASSPRSPKRLGELAESLFQTRALALGYIVCKPFGDSAPFDCVVYGAGRVPKRVQVKACFLHSRSGRVHWIDCHDSSGSPYKPEEVDLVAGYVADENAWYIIPVKRLANRVSIAFCLRSRRRRRPLWERYRENWWRLGRLPKRINI